MIMMRNRKTIYDLYLQRIKSRNKNTIIQKQQKHDEEDKMRKFEKKAREIGVLLEEKNAAYGNAFIESERVLKVLYPNGVRPDQYTDMLAITRVLDKLFRIANRKDAFGENPWEDIAGYGILMSATDDEEIIELTEEHRVK